MDSSVRSVWTGDRIWRVVAGTDTIASMRGPCCVVLGLGLWLLSSSLPTVAAADIYRYVDGDGIEHYTNIQPKTRGWQRVLRTGNSSAAARALRRGRSGQGGDAERARRYDAHIREAALLYVLPEEFIRAVMRVESNFYPECVSHKGAMGLMQLMPATATSMGVLDPFDARQNILGGARFLRVLANNFGGDLVLTIAAYNAGEGAVRRYGGIPPYTETRRYVQRVLTHYYAFRVASGENRALAKR
jgi:soluble lytic murein transglycosylase-like protein